MLELGQPLHAYDAARVQGAIRSRLGEQDERLTLLDEKEIVVNGDTLVIADDSGAIGLAGIMGGLGTAVSEETTDVFFEALYGDADEGAYDINLVFNRYQSNQLHFEFHLTQRPGRCLACNLTYGLPAVFERHPIIDVAGLVDKIGQQLEYGVSVSDWSLGPTREISPQLHTVPLIITTG